MVHYNVEVNFLLRLFTEFEVGQEDLSYLEKDAEIIPKPDEKNDETTSERDYLWKYLLDPDYNPYEHLDEIYDSELVTAAPHIGVDVVSSSKDSNSNDETPKKKDPELLLQANFDCSESSTKNQCCVM